MTDEALVQSAAAGDRDAFAAIAADRRECPLVRLFMATGARLSEIANLRWTPADGICWPRSCGDA